ncbi:hypothetical protein BaRGS_00019058 [Batillaria attramentaria]|uniref:Uncharacterized protein n=1 Tax=Batillaria attramentaria TaxID=370345 RepID=A0ABD0KS37_9CAEN
MAARITASSAAGHGEQGRQEIILPSEDEGWNTGLTLAVSVRVFVKLSITFGSHSGPLSISGGQYNNQHGINLLHRAVVSVHTAVLSPGNPGHCAAELVRTSVVKVKYSIGFSFRVSGAPAVIMASRQQFLMQMKDSRV